MKTALCPPLRPALSRLYALLAAWAVLLAGSNLQAANTITKNVILGGTLDISPISSIYPALPAGSPPEDAYARMMVMHTTIPGTTECIWPGKRVAQHSEPHSGLAGVSL
jgi:hypothetical protein